MRLSRSVEKVGGSALRTTAKILSASIAVMMSSSAIALEWDADPTTPGAQGGSGVWNDGSFWWDGSQSVPWVSGGAAVFGGTPGTVEINVSFLQMSNLTFTSSYKLVQTTQSPLRVHGAITVGQGAEVEIESFLQGGLTKEGGGTLTLFGSGSSGPTTINGGTLVTNGVSENYSLTIAAAATLKLTESYPYVARVPALFGSGTIEIGANTLTVMDSSIGQTTPSLFEGVIAGAGGVIFQKAGTYSGMGSSFTGGATIAAQISVPTIMDKGVNGPLGAGESITFGQGGQLTITGSEPARSDRAVVLGATGGSLSISSATGEVALVGEISGPGSLVTIQVGCLSCFVDFQGLTRGEISKNQEKRPETGVFWKSAFRNPLKINGPAYLNSYDP